MMKEDISETLYVFRHRAKMVGNPIEETPIVLTISMSPVAHKHLIESLCFADLRNKDNEQPLKFEGASVIINQSQSEDWRVFQG